MPFRSPRGKPQGYPGPVISPPPTQNPGSLPRKKTRRIRPNPSPFKPVVLVKRGKLTPAGREYYGLPEKPKLSERRRVVRKRRPK